MVAAEDYNKDFAHFAKKTQRRLNSIERHKHAAMGRVLKGNRDVPKPPTFVQYESVMVGGVPTMRSTWTPPTENTDGTELVDLSGYHVQQQIGLTTEWATPTEWAPGKPDDTLNRLFNRNGLGEGWTGGDGGASGRDTSGKDWWFWSDSNWGALAGNGDTLRWIMMRNSITTTVGTDPESMTLHAGRMNLLPSVLTSADWSVRDAGTLTDVEGGVEWGPLAGGGHLDMVDRLPVSEGEALTFSIEHDSTALVFIDWFSGGSYMGENVSGGAAPIASVAGVAPEGADEARLRVYTNSGSPMTVTHVYAAGGDARMASWRSGIKEYQFTNLILNPTGSGSAPTTGSAALFTNHATNPSAEADVGTNTNTYSGVTDERVAVTDAWVGGHVLRLNRNQAGNGLLALLDYGSGTVAGGDEVAYRFRVRAAQMADPNSTLSVSINYYDGGSGTGGGSSTTVNVAPDGGWQTVTVTGVVAPAANNLGVRLSASGSAWSASDIIEVDARELYINEQPPEDYFDGSTPDGGSWLYTWSGAPYESSSVATLSYVQRTNRALDPTIQSPADWSTVGASSFEVDGGTTRRGAQTVPLPDVVNPGVLDPVRAALDDPQAMLGIGVVSDSTGETTGALGNPDLSDRYIETLQESLRRYQNSPDVRLVPEGYYGASAYVPAVFWHPGPVDWETHGPNQNATPAGVGGRTLILPYGSRASLRATFDSAVVELPTSGYGRDAAIFVDGVKMTTIRMYGLSGELIQWDTGSLGYGEHLITVESQRTDGFTNGDIWLSGAMLFDGADDQVGTRVYDMTASGLAAEDVVNRTRVLPDNLKRHVDLMIWSLDFNDAGRGITPSQHKANLHALLDRQATLGFVGVNLIMAKWEPSATVTASWPSPMSAYAQAMREVAQERTDSAFIDLSEVMPNPDDDPSLYQDPIHQNEIGHQRIASVLNGVILGQDNTGSLLVETNAEGEGVIYSGFAPGAFSDGQPFTASAYIRGPVGRVVRGQIAALGQSLTVGAPVTFTGGWDRVVVSGRRLPSATTAPQVQFVQGDTGGAMQWRASDLLVEDGLVAGGFFYSGTADSPDINYDSNPEGESTASGYAPAHWETDVGTMVVFDPNRAHGFEGSVHVFPTGTGPAEVDVMMSGNSAGVTHVGWVYIPTAEQTVQAAGLRWDGSQYIESGSDTVSGPGWVEYRFPGEGTHGGTRLRSDLPFHATEITVVSDPEPYEGPAFSGGSQGAHAKSVWNGARGMSESTLTLSNTSYTSDPDQKMTLIQPEAAGLEGWKFMWCQGAHVEGDRAVMFLQTLFHRPIIQNSGFNFHRFGDIVIAHFDLASGALVDVVNAFPKSPYEWGEASFSDATHLYLYGKDGQSVYVMRAPLAVMSDPSLWAQSEVWDGSAWTVGGTPEPVADTPSGFTGVRLVDDQYVALEVGQFDNHLSSWVAPAPQGPFVPDDIVYVFPDDGIHRYVPRFHPQFDTNSGGIVMSVCEAGGNKYGPTFLRGPAGVRSANFGDAYWGTTHIVDSAEFIQSLVEQGTPYRVRVRAVDKSGNVSEWALGDEVTSGDWTEGVPKPSTPVADAWFRGGRVVWDGLDEYGNEYEGFRYYEVHLNGGSPNWTLSAWTRIDSSIVAGGVTPVTVGDYGTYYVRVVAVTVDGRSVASEPVSFEPERLSDPDLADTLIDGARLRPGTVNASALTVSAFTDNLLPNGGFEDESRAEPGIPARWNGGWPRGEGDWANIGWEASGSFYRDEVDPVSGTASLRIETTDVSWRQVVSDVIPVQPGDVYYVAARIRTDGIDGEIAVSLLTGHEQDDVGGFAGPENRTTLVGVTAGGQTSTLVEGPVEVQDRAGDGSGLPMRFAAVSIEARATGRAYTSWVDEIEVKRVVGTAALANASINRAKIRYLAVDDARIASVGVGKLVAGELFADITVSSRIMTAKTGKRWEANPDGAFTFNPNLTSGDDQVPVTEMRASDGGLVSRWFRTNTTGTRIEMGTYGTGAGSALMSFYPDENQETGGWLFPPAMGFGGSARHGNLAPGIGIHAGSERGPENSEGLYYEQYGMSMIGVSQRGGIHLVTGNLLNGTAASYGSPITMNAGGEDSYIDLKSGSRENWADPARLRLDPQRGQSLLALNHGRIQFVETGGGASEHYKIEFVSGEDWLGINHLHIRTGYGALRVSNGVYSNALLLNGGTLTIPGDMAASGSLKRGESSAGRVLTRQGTTLEWDRYGNPWTSQGTARATTAFWVNSAGNIEGQGSWNVPRIKVRAQESYVSFDAQGGIYVDGSSVKSFVIPHPVDEERYLVHAAHEGDEMRVVYEGTSETEPGEGSRLVRLPDYFDALTVDGTEVVLLSEMVCDHGPRCDCSVKHTPVRGNSFEVHANTTSHAVPFSWRVTAVRAGTEFATEPSKRDTVVRGDGPYTYIESR